MKNRIVTTPEDMVALGAHIGQRLRGGEVIELVSDLGGGKTTLTRGLAQGFGSDDQVASPTFTISRVYTAGDRAMHHFDFYRLGESGLIAHELQDLLGDPQVVIIVEWGGVVAEVMPASTVHIEITKTPEGSREVSVDCPDEYAYLVVGL